MKYITRWMTLGFAVVIASAAGDIPDSDLKVTLALVIQSSGTGALLQAVSPVTDEVVWVSGHQATYARTLDGGEVWEASVVPGVGDLQFRDVAAFDARTAYLMSAGNGTQSRIYKTDDGGVSWRLQYTAQHPDAFFDCMDFWSPDVGVVYGDAIDGVPFLLRTEDAGETWARVSAEGLPLALEGEGGFAASGTCLVTGAGGRAWVAMGSGERARVLATRDFGVSWDVADVPVVAGSGSGLTTIQVSPNGNGIALGGVIGDDSVRSRNVAVTADSGETWREGGALSMAGPVYGSAMVPGADSIVIAVGPRGMDWSTDFGTTWRSVGTLTYWAVGFASGRVGWAVGPDGRVAKLTIAER